MPATAETVAVIKELYDEGDLTEDFQGYRDAFQEHVGRATTLTDEDLIEMVAASADDKALDEWVQNMVEMEKSKAR